MKIDHIYKQNVAVGIAELDAMEGRGNWEHKVNLDELDLDSMTKCVLGQIYGTFELGIINRYRHGFDDRRKVTRMAYIGDSRDIILNEWKHQILLRRMNLAVEKINEFAKKLEEVTKQEFVLVA